jgi:hypothetical protein
VSTHHTFWACSLCQQGLTPEPEIIEPDPHPDAPGRLCGLCKRVSTTVRRCRQNRLEAAAALRNANELEEARECYFAAGGVESQIGPRDNPMWYWRRAAKCWRDRAEYPDAPPPPPPDKPANEGAPAAPDGYPTVKLRWDAATGTLQAADESQAHLVRQAYLFFPVD